MADRAGQQLGNYLLIRLLGRGGFAEVYLGEHLHLKTRAAIKVLHTQLADKDVDAFLKEAQTIAHLEHPHIVRVLDFDVAGGVPFLVMSYAPEGSLRQRHPKGTRLLPESILPYVKQIADALQYAHEEKLIHRDVKPENMLVGRRNEVLLSDFGLALIMQSSRYQSFQEVAGTVSYMAPEQIQGRPRPASDQYALGIVIYEWLCGSRPFQGSFTEIATQQVLAPPPPLHQSLPGVSPAIEQVVLRALAKDPHQRFASVQEFASAFEQACQPSLTFRPDTLASQPPPSAGPTTLLNQSSQSTDTTAPLSQPPLPYSPNTPPNIAAQSFSPTTPPKQLPLSSRLNTPPDIAPQASIPYMPADSLQPTKRGVSRRVVLTGLAGLAVAGGGITWLLTGGINRLFPGGPTNLTLSGPVVSVDSTNHTVTLSVNGQNTTIKNVPDNVITLLQGQVGKAYSFQVTQNSDGSYTIVAGTNVIPEAQEGYQTSSANEPGSIQFIGKIASSSNGNVVVSLPGGSSFSMSTNAQTDLGDFNGSLPGVNTQVKVKAKANSDGSFTATKIGDVVNSDDPNQVQLQGVTTQAVGADRVIHFTVGNKSFSFPIASTADLSNFGGNAQSIASGVTVMVTVEFSGTTGSVTRVGNPHP
jgi:serine/threonine protein kinase